jgi:hypothetical protein
MRKEALEMIVEGIHRHGGLLGQAAHKPHAGTGQHDKEQPQGQLAGRQTGDEVTGAGDKAHGSNVRIKENEGFNWADVKADSYNFT